MDLPKINISNFMIASVMMSVFAYTLGNIVDNVIFPEYVEGDNKNEILIELILQISAVVILRYYSSIIITTLLSKTMKLSPRSIQAAGLIFPFMMHYPMDNFKKRVKYFGNLIE